MAFGNTKFRDAFFTLWLFYTYSAWPSKGYNQNVNRRTVISNQQSIKNRIAFSITAKNTNRSFTTSSIFKVDNKEDRHSDKQSPNRQFEATQQVLFLNRTLSRKHSVNFLPVVLNRSHTYHTNIIRIDIRRK